MSDPATTVLHHDQVFHQIKWKNGTEETYLEDALALAILLANEVIFLNEYWWEDEWPEEARKRTALCVGCNDVFMWGSADAEDLFFSELQDLYEHWVKDPEWGSAVWCIKRRKMMPQPPVEDRIRAAGIWDLDSMGLEINPAKKPKEPA